MGLDPGFTHWGLVWGGYAPASGTLSLIGCACITTKKSQHRLVRVASDDIARARALYGEVSRVIRAQRPAVVALEIAGGSQSARANRALGICLGLAVGLEDAADTPFIEVTAREAKQAACGQVTASKEAVMGWAVAAHPRLAWPKSAALLEHCADAAAVLQAAIETAWFRQIVALRVAA